MFFRTFIVVCAALVIPTGGRAVFLLAPSAESLTIECRGDGLYFGFQIDGLPACSDMSCMWIRARTDGGEWVKYGAHRGSHNGRVRSKGDFAQFKKVGELGEVLVGKLTKAKAVEFQNPVTDAPVRFAISESDREDLANVARTCASTP